MKKAMWHFAVMMLAGFVLIAVSFLYADVLRNGQLIGNIGFGVAGASAVHLILRWRWSRPKNRDKYDKKMRSKRIEIQDEMKTMLRHKAAHVAYSIMFQVLFLTGLILAFIGVEEWMVLVIFSLLLIQYFIGIIAYHRLLNKQTRE